MAGRPSWPCTTGGRCFADFSPNKEDPTTKSRPTRRGFLAASALNELLMLGNVATQFEGALEYDPQAMRIAGNAQADGLLRCEYRRGWEL